MSAVTLTTADGVRLAARWCGPATPAGEAVVVVHGFCGSKDRPEVELLALRLAAGGRPTLTFDLRGHGGSQGTSTLGLLERLDVDAAVAAARADADIVVVVGASMGGVATIDHLATVSEDGPSARSGADGGVVVATPARWQVPRSARGVLAVALTQTRPGRAVTSRRMGTRVAVRPRRGAPPTERMAAVRQPVAVIHGLADRFVAPGAARELFAAVDDPRLLALVPGMGHGFCAAALDPVDASVAWVVGRVAATRAASRGGS